MCLAFMFCFSGLKNNPSPFTCSWGGMVSRPYHLCTFSWWPISLLNLESHEYCEDITRFLKMELSFLVTMVLRVHQRSVRSLWRAGAEACCSLSEAAAQGGTII